MRRLPCGISRVGGRVRVKALLRGRAWVAQLCATSVGAVRLRALPFFLLYSCLRVDASRCGPAALVGRGCWVFRRGKLVIIKLIIINLYVVVYLADASAPPKVSRRQRPQARYY